MAKAKEATIDRNGVAVDTLASKRKVTSVRSLLNLARRNGVVDLYILTFGYLRCGRFLTYEGNGVYLYESQTDGQRLGRYSSAEGLASGSPELALAIADGRCFRY